jgi:hypothetical protein
MTKCPFCFVELPRSSGAFVCVGTCLEKPDPKASAARGTAVSNRTVFTWPHDPTQRRPRPQSLYCSACGVATSQAICPECHFLLPAGWHELTTTCITLAGARASGKSVYIAVLKRQAEMLAQRLGGSLGFFDQATANTFALWYENPLWQARKMLGPTARYTAPDSTVRSPLMFTMPVRNSPGHVLVIRDVAGENLEDPNDLPPSAFAFFGHADGLFFLVDPLRIDAIRNMLTGVIPEPREPGGDPLLVFDNLVRVLRDRGNREKIDTPLALVLSKFDALQALAKVEDPEWGAFMRQPGAAYLRDPSLEQLAFDPDDADLLGAEVRSLLVRLQGTSLLNRTDVFRHMHLFAVSALGMPPVGESLNPGGLAPFRCLDPLKWVLSQTGVIPVVTRSRVRA